MFSLVKQVFIVLLSFSSSLARVRIKFLSLNDEPCMTRPTLIDLNPAGLKYYPFTRNVMEVVMSYLQKDLFQETQKT